MIVRGWHTVAASATGASHAAAGIGNCDAHSFAPYGPAGVSLVVADGLGSAPEAALAARAAVALAARRLAGGPAAGEDADPLLAQRDHVRTAVAEARAGLHDLAGALRLPIADLGTTLLVCVVSEAGAAFGGVGDGFLAVRARMPGGTRRHHLLTLTPPGRFANETATLASASDIVVEAIDDPAIDGLALASDGLEAVAIDRPLASDRDLRSGSIDVLLTHADTAVDSRGLHRDIVQATWDRATADDRTIVMAVAR